jgi:hypothetical protein
VLLRTAAATVGSLPVSGRRRVVTPAARGGQIWPFDGRLEGARGLAALLGMEGGGGCGQPSRPLGL